MTSRLENLTEFFVEMHSGRMPTQREKAVIAHLDTLGACYDAIAAERHDVRLDRKMSDDSKAVKLRSFKALEDVMNRSSIALRKHLRIERKDPGTHIKCGSGARNQYKRSVE